jgi:hypothetical protein
VIFVPALRHFAEVKHHLRLSSWKVSGVVVVKVGVAAMEILMGGSAFYGLRQSLAPAWEA